MEPINDYELFYLLQEGNEQLTDFIINKYIPLVHKILFKLNITKRDWEDYFQEGLMILHKCILTYHESKGLFYSYCSICITRRIVRLLQQNKDNLYDISFDDSILLKESPVFYNQEIAKMKEFQILLEIKTLTPKKYAEQHQLEIKYVYNQIYYLKSILKKYKNKL